MKKIKKILPDLVVLVVFIFNIWATAYMHKMSIILSIQQMDSTWKVFSFILIVYLLYSIVSKLRKNKDQ